MESEYESSQSTLQQSSGNMSQLPQKANGELSFVVSIPSYFVHFEYVSNLVVSLEILPQYREWVKMIIESIKQSPLRRKQVDKGPPKIEEGEEESLPQEEKFQREAQPKAEIATLQVQKYRTHHYRQENEKKMLSAAEDQYELMAIQKELEEVRAEKQRAKAKQMEAKEQERKAIEQERKAKEQERKAIEQERKAREQEKKAREQEKKARKEQRKAIQQEREAREEVMKAREQERKARKEEMKAREEVQNVNELLQKTIQKLNQMEQKGKKAEQLSKEVSGMKIQIIEVLFQLEAEIKNKTQAELYAKESEQRLEQEKARNFNSENELRARIIVLEQLLNSRPLDPNQTFP